MSLLRTLFPTIALATSGLSVNASPIYSQAEWNKLIPAHLATRESFEFDSHGQALPAPVKDISQYDFGNVSVSSGHFDVVNRTNFGDRYVNDGSYAVRGVPGGWQPANEPYGPLTFTFDQSINFLSLYVMDLGTSTGTSTLTYALDGGAFTDLISQGSSTGTNGANNNFEGSSLFAGIISDTLFTTITFGFNSSLSGNKDDFVGFDNFTFGTTASIPEPETLGLLVLGLLGIAVGRKTRY